MAKKNNSSTVTIKEIATMCNVSISTVSNYLNGKSGKVSAEVADKIKECVERTGYKPNYLAKNLRSISTKTIGIIAEDLIQFSVPSMIEGVMKCCEANGYDVVIENLRLFGRWSGTWMHDEALFQSALKPVLLKMDALNVDGILYVGGHEHTVKNLKSANGTPIVMSYAYSDDSTIPTFRLDDFTGGYDVFKYLFKKGHKKIGIIAGESDNAHTINRMHGIQKAIYEEGILFDPSLVFYETWTKQGGYKGARELIKQNPTAIFCMNDQIASGVYAYLKEVNLEPGKDISVMGYDNHEISKYLTPELTTMSLPLEEMGLMAVKKLIDICEDKPDEKPSCVDVRISSTLVERNSVVDLT